MRDATFRKIAEELLRDAQRVTLLGSQLFLQLVRSVLLRRLTHLLRAVQISPGVLAKFDADLRKIVVRRLELRHDTPDECVRLPLDCNGLGVCALSEIAVPAAVGGALSALGSLHALDFRSFTVVRDLLLGKSVGPMSGAPADCELYSAARSCLSLRPPATQMEMLCRAGIARA